jgi:putative tryptophan/tyrosine transport system substrate-binding protein
MKKAARPAILATVILLAVAVITEAQQPAKIPRIGALHLGTTKVAAPFLEAFEHGLKDLGYVIGSNLLVEYRYADGKAERYSQLVSELVTLKPALIVVWGTDVAEAAKRTTTTVPIVFALADRPDVLGLVSSLARPGSNLTGLTTLNFELTNKRLELLKEIIPGLTRVVVLSMHHPLVSVTVKEAEVPARSLGVRLQTTEIKGPDDLDGAFNRLAEDQPGALLLLPAREAVYGPRAVSRALTQRLPTIGSQTLITDAGGLISYGPRTADMSFRAATYVDKILKGAKPADLPVEQPTKFEFVINLKTAKQIGVTIPPNVLARADKVIK